MPITIAKLLWTLVQPLSLTTIATIVAIILLAMRRRKLAMTLLLLNATLMFLATFTSLGYLLIAPLEDRFTRPPLAPKDVAAIIVLGGGIDGEVSHARQLTELTAGGDRFVEGLRLAHQYPHARLVISGGFGSMVAEGESDADAARRFYTAFGISADRLILEGDSRSTAENATFTRSLLANQTQGATLLVTSAFHMPRSVAFFRRAGLSVTAWPADYRSTGHEPFRFDPTNPPENLLTVTTATREWIALFIYSTLGQIDELFPAP